MNSTEYMYDGSVEQQNNYFPYGGLLNDVTNSMDPLCETTYHMSPYVFCMGNPVNGIIC